MSSAKEAPMIRVVTNDGLELTAKDAAELVAMLHSASYNQAENDQDWMRKTAELTEEQTGNTIRTFSAAVFIKDLIQLGLLKELDENENGDDIRHEDSIKDTRHGLED